MYAKPDPKKLAAIKARADAELARAQEIEAAYREHRTGQARYEKAFERDEIIDPFDAAMTAIRVRNLTQEDELLRVAAELGIDLSNYVPMDNHPAFQTAA